MEELKIQRESIYKLTININPNNAIGPDNITGKILKENINICSNILIIIFTKSIQSGKVSSDLNHASVTHVFKKETSTTLKTIYPGADPGFQARGRGT